MPIKSFRNMIKDDTVQTIPLSTNDGSTGYRIRKFQVINKSPGTNHTEAIIKIYKIDQLKYLTKIFMLHTKTILTKLKLIITLN
jgi:hypothetical protein